MSKDAIITLLGIWVAVVPFLGFPGAWRTVLLVLSGVLIAAIGIQLRRELLSKGWPFMRRHSESYVENRASGNFHGKTEESAS